MEIRTSMSKPLVIVAQRVHEKSMLWLGVNYLAPESRHHFSVLQQCCYGQLKIHIQPSYATDSQQAIASAELREQAHPNPYGSTTSIPPESKTVSVNTSGSNS